MCKMKELVNEWEEELTGPRSDTIQLGLAAYLWMTELGIKNWTDFKGTPIEPLIMKFLEIDLIMANSI